MDTAQRVNGRTVRVIRELSGIKQKDLAQACGISTSYLSLIESGVRDPYDPELATALAEAFGINVKAIAYNGPARTKKTAV